MGQGIHTGLATIVAEELDAEFERVRVVNAANGRGPNGDAYGNPEFDSAFQFKGASNSGSPAKGVGEAGLRLCC